MRRLATVLALAALALGGCGDDPPRATTAPDAAPEAGPFERATVVIETKQGPVRVSVEVAESDDQRALGLMLRESLPPDAGMVFLYDEETTGGFWMKNTLIPLSIAFFDGSGKIVRILDMEPCREDPCTVYEPGVPYRGALEVNRGFFRRAGVEVGDRVRVER